MNSLQNVVRAKDYPQVLRSGPSSRSGADQLGRALAWFGILLGAAELLAAGGITRALGLKRAEALVRAFGVREIGAGILSLSTEKDIGLWSRLAGDGLDLATLAAALRDDNPERGNVRLALAMVLGVAVLDFWAARAVTASRRRTSASRPSRNYRDRSGFPEGLEKARGAAKDIARHAKVPNPEPAKAAQ